MSTKNNTQYDVDTLYQATFLDTEVYHRKWNNYASTNPYILMYYMPRTSTLRMIIFT